MIPLVACAAVFLWVALSGCDSRESAECRERYLKAHATVSGVDTESSESVETCLATVQGALEVCSRANLREETTQLNKALRKLQSHQAHLAHQASQDPLTPEQFEQLVKNGDPACPTGQQYQHRKSAQKIRCTGPQLSEMNWREAETYFASRGYKIGKQENVLRAEYGSESFNYQFARAEDTRSATCLTLFAAPGIAWQEAVSRATGVRPGDLRAGAPVRTRAGTLALGLIEDQNQAIIKLGKCEE